MEPTTEMTRLSGELATYAVRLVRLIRQHNPQSSGMRALSALDERGPLGITTLAELDNCSQPTMTGIVRHLVDQGWATREQHPTDARRALVALTDDGRAELARVRSANATFVASRLVGHPEHTTADLATAVAVLRDVLSESTPPTSTKEPTL